MKFHEYKYSLYSVLFFFLPGARTRTKLEKSGEVVLEVTALLFSKLLQVDVDLQINGQNLFDLDPYFNSNDSIILKGNLLHGRSYVQVRGDNLNARVQAKYQSLNIEFKKNRERSGISAFFSNLAKSIKIEEQNLDLVKKDQVRAVQLKRKPLESLISFIFRGMKEAAMKVASAG